MKSYICQTCGTQVGIAAVGDGAMQMLGNAGLLTISKSWKQWLDSRLVVLGLTTSTAIR